jgi:hypothetical protein
MAKVAAIDFDGVIHRYSKGWHDGTIYDPPIEGTKNSLERLREAGYFILIFSSRAADRVVDGETHPGQAEEIERYLDSYEIPYDQVWRGEKPIYDVLIDDRAVRFVPELPRWQRVLNTPWSLCLSLLEEIGILSPGE